MAKAQTSPRPPTVGELRKSVEDALAKGLKPADLVLNLTLRDAAAIRRSSLFADDEIRFSDGAMHVLGIRTTAGEVPESALEADSAGSAE